MREITETKQTFLNLGMPFYDHANGLEWLSTRKRNNNIQKGGSANATSTSELLEFS